MQVGHKCRIHTRIDTVRKPFSHYIALNDNSDCDSSPRERDRKLEGTATENRDFISHSIQEDRASVSASRFWVHTRIDIVREHYPRCVSSNESSDCGTSPRHRDKENRWKQRKTLLTEALESLGPILKRQNCASVSLQVRILENR